MSRLVLFRQLYIEKWFCFEEDFNGFVFMHLVIARLSQQFSIMSLLNRWTIHWKQIVTTALICSTDSVTYKIEMIFFSAHQNYMGRQHGSTQLSVEDRLLKKPLSRNSDDFAFQSFFFIWSLLSLLLYFSLSNSTKICIFWYQLIW